MISQAAISIRNLRKSYKSGKRHYRQGSKSGPANMEREALKGVDLTIEKGSFFGLLGPNGAGKSTLINILAGLTLKSSGEVRVMGFDLDRNPREVRRQLGIVPQELVLDPFFNVRETLEYYAGYFGVPAAERKTDEIIEALGLSDKKTANSRRLSGGMKRRVLIAKALVHQPPILILDEPTAGVDVDLRQQLWEYVKVLNRNGATILLTTHYLEEAEELCDQIAIIDHGEIIACDKKENLLATLEQKQLTIKLSEPIENLPPSLNGFAATLKDKCTIVINYKVSEMMIGKLISLLQAEGLAIKDLSTLEPNLEDIFRHLTKSA